MNDGKQDDGGSSNANAAMASGDTLEAAGSGADAGDGCSSAT
eukprot:CAMPEP_0197540790 /NCGR_PEP_ID=MMETSP1318-20131121/66798_1 /TAXON_ID=552666 /ORGANISM="Partenskyella glossopodia, Strain RCC365" /LENGTH=41 /DNA_ID= /DNA_START= /DNA_END= /DNA_ORIENTATION=